MKKIAKTPEDKAKRVAALKTLRAAQRAARTAYKEWRKLNPLKFARRRGGRVGGFEHRGREENLGELAMNVVKLGATPERAFALAEALDKRLEKSMPKNYKTLRHRRMVSEDREASSYRQAVWSVNEILLQVLKDGGHVARDRQGADALARKAWDVALGYERIASARFEAAKQRDENERLEKKAKAAR